jgi:preprotein translocase subunit SecG
MLSFLREQGAEGPKSHKTENGLGAVNDPTKPGQSAPMSGIDAESGQQAGEQEYLTIATHNETARKSTIMLVVLFSIGMLCLWLMIKKSTPQTASASTADTEETQIEAAISRLTGVESEMFNRLDKIVKKFYEFSDVYQVKVDELAKNPFKLEILLSNKSGTGGKDSINTEMMKQQQLRLQAGNLELLSIMPSARGYCCMIDDTILYVGDSIKGFKVSQIGDDFVKLESESAGTDPNSDKAPLGIQIVLRLSE